jgi:histidinol-phosphatase
VDLSEALELARRLALIGGRTAASYYGRDYDTALKADGTWATEADIQAERAMRIELARAHPEHNVLGEEQGLTAASGEEARPGAPTWVIDPIDGTNNFMRRIPIWGTLVGLEVDGRFVAGAAYAPALDELYDAATGLGARMNDAPIAVDPLDDLSKATVVLGGDRYFAEIGMETLPAELARRSARSRGFGDFWGHTLVARGAAHVMVDPILSPWDYAALVPIVTEAGGRVSQLDGSEPAPQGSVVSTNGILHDEVLAVAALIRA